MTVTPLRDNADMDTGGVIRFWTENSVYEIESSLSLMRRLAGARAPTAHQGADGRWRAFTDISPIAVGRPVVVTWDIRIDDRVAQRTTSSVIGVAVGESAKPPAWVAAMIESTQRPQR